MNARSLPIHPYLTHPFTGRPLQAVGVVAGRYVWPILGGSEPAGDPGAGGKDPAGQQPNPGQQQQQYTPPASQADLDRIVETRLSRERAKYGNLTPEQLGELQAKAEAHDKMQYDLSSEHEKALADAKTETAADVAAVYVPQLVAAHIDAAAARKGISDEDLAKATKYLDSALFLAENGSDIDPAKIAEFVEGITPAATGNGLRVISPPRQLGQGNQPPAAVKPGDAGRAMAEKRFGNKK